MTDSAAWRNSAKERDRPRLLGDATANAERVSQLALPHMRPLVAFVERLRREQGLTREVPHFDPWDGGVDARILFVLEAPGPKTIASGFVSRNNPDESASNFFRANVDAGIPRERTVSWNVVPWALRDADGRARAPREADLRLGISYLEQLASLLPNLGAIVFVGRKAEQASGVFERARPDVLRFVSPHPSPQFVNRFPENRERLTDALRAVARVT